VAASPRRGPRAVRACRHPGRGLGRRDVARRRVGGGERIPASRPSRERLTTAVAALSLAGGVVAYADVASDRLPEVAGGIGVVGCALIAFALFTRWRSVFPFGLALVGASYGVYVALRNGAVDARAPAVAAVLFAVAELGFWSLERAPSQSEGTVLVRRAAALAGGVLLTAFLGSLLLVLATGVSGGVGLEAAGVAAAVLALAAIVRLASRASA
jgi:hypothetical protein